MPQADVESLVTEAEAGSVTKSGGALGTRDGSRRGGTPEAFRRVKRVLARRWSDLVFLALALCLLAAVTWDAFFVRVVTMSQGADYWEHSATMRALMDDPWHPKNPHLVSPASSPRFVPLFLVSALIARSLELDALGAMGVASSLHTALLLAAIYVFFRVYFRDSRASLYGLLVMFGSWIDAWHFSNVYQLKIYFSVASYPSTAALALSLLGFTLTTLILRRKLQERFGLPLLAGCTACLLVTHPLTAMLGLAGAGLLGLTEPGVAWRTRFHVAGALLVGVVLSGVWPYFSVWNVLRGGTHQEVSWVPGGSASSAEEPSGASHFFYRIGGLVDALGYALLGVPVIVGMLVFRRHLFIVLGALAMSTPFVVNLYIALPLGHRFILLAVFFLQAAVVWLLLVLTRGTPRYVLWLAKRWPRRITSVLVAGFLAYITYTNVDQAIGRLDQGVRRLRGEGRNVRYSRAVAQFAGANAVVLADAKVSWPIPTFGPKVIPLFHPNPLVTDQDKRNAEVRYFFRPSAKDAHRTALLEAYGVTHVVVEASRERPLRRFLSARGARRALPGGYVLYSLRRK